MSTGAGAPTAIFMGAGASKPFGYPLTGELLPEMLRQLDAGTLFERFGLGPDSSSAGDRQLLGSLLNRLLPGLRNVEPEKLPLITEILSLLDYSIGEGHALYPRQSEGELRRARLVIERALLEVLFPPEQYEDERDRLMSRGTRRRESSS